MLETVSAKLKSCAVQIVVCSPISVTKPWINFEAGAAWIRDIPVIPLCHSGITPGKLPIPLSLLQAANLTDIASMNLVVPVLAAALGAKTPKIDFGEMVTTIKEFETKYTFWNRCNECFKVINDINPQIIARLRTHPIVQIELPESQIVALEAIIPFLRSQALVDLQRTGNTSFATNGVFFGCELVKLARLDVVFGSPHFMFP